jgi:hypothetical protein
MSTTRTIRRRTPVCPRCASSDVAWILPGYPIHSPELEADLGAGRVVLGGCVVWDDQSDHRCNACGAEFRADGRPVRIPEGDE